MFTPGADPNLEPIEDNANRVTSHPIANFQFAYDPDDWQLDEESNLVPVIVHLTKAPGVNGVDKDGDFRPARLRYESLGYRMIPHDVLPGGYVAPYTSTKGKAVHRTVFERADTVHGATRWTHDAQAWRGFIRLLRRKGIIEQPRPTTLASMIEVREGVLNGMRQPRVDDAEGLERYNTRVAKLKADLATLRAEYDTSVEKYGAPESPARNSLLAALAEDDDGKLAEMAEKPKRKK